MRWTVLTLEVVRREKLNEDAIFVIKLFCNFVFVVLSYFEQVKQ
jgi:hypothetical protein